MVLTRIAAALALSAHAHGQAPQGRGRGAVDLPDGPAKPMVMMPTADGNLAIAESGGNKVGLVVIGG